MNEIKVEGEIKWTSVYLEENQRYEFPSKINAYMRANYKHPAIYRWSIRSVNDIEGVYVGETELFIPRRIYHYLNPGPSQQTNIRLNREFNDLIGNGKRVTLEILDLESITANGSIISNEELESKYLRKGLEGVIIYLLITEGFNVINA